MPLTPLVTQYMAEQAYDVFVTLTVPNVNANYDIGNFMVQLDIVSGTSEHLVTAKKAAILLYRSYLVQTMSTILSCWPVLLGLQDESQEITTILLQDFVFEKAWLKGPLFARVEVHASGLRVYQSSIEIRTKLRGVQRLLYHYKLLSFLVFTVSFWLFSLTFALVSWAVAWSVATANINVRGIRPLDAMNQVPHAPYDDSIGDKGVESREDVARNLPRAQAHSSSSASTMPIFEFDTGTRASSRASSFVTNPTIYSDLPKKEEDAALDSWDPR